MDEVHHESILYRQRTCHEPDLPRPRHDSCQEIPMSGDTRHRTPTTAEIHHHRIWTSIEINHMENKSRAECLKNTPIFPMPLCACIAASENTCRDILDQVTGLKSHRRRVLTQFYS